MSKIFWREDLATNLQVGIDSWIISFFFTDFPTQEIFLLGCFVVFGFVCLVCFVMYISFLNVYCYFYSSRLMAFCEDGNRQIKLGNIFHNLEPHQSLRKKKKKPHRL